MLAKGTCSFLLQLTNRLDISRRHFPFTSQAVAYVLQTVYQVIHMHAESLHWLWLEVESSNVIIFPQ